MFGPFISSDLKVICFCKPSNKMTNLFGVEYDEFFLNEIDFSLKNIEELLIGLPVAYDLEKKYFQLDPNHESYVMCSHSKRELKKMDKGQLDGIVFYYALSEEPNQLKTISLVHPSEQTKIIIDYKSRQLIDGHLLPKQVEIQIVSAEGEITIAMDYRKTRINEVESIHFIIPENYEVCE